MVPERHNKVKVLLLLDVGGTMDDHIHARRGAVLAPRRPSSSTSSSIYFHNCVYDFLWKNNRRRHARAHADLGRAAQVQARTTKLIFVGDATMSPYEILQPGGSVEYNNDEAGAVWLQRLTDHFPKFAWLNPEPEPLWQYRQSIAVIHQIMTQRMFPLTIEGLERGMRLLSK